MQDKSPNKKIHAKSQKLHSSYLVATLLPPGDFGRYV